jgi:hypothetical protein
VFDIILFFVDILLLLVIVLLTVTSYLCFQYLPLFGTRTVLSSFLYVDIIEQLDHKTRAPFERQFASILHAVRLALEEIERTLDRCNYAWIRLSDIAISI